MMRWAWWLMLVLIAGVGCAAQIDRASARNPALALAVPGPFRGFAQLTHAQLALATGTPAAALREAQTLVRRRPIPAEHLMILAAADLRARDVDGFRAVFRTATTRGWRVPELQLIAAQSAIARGEMELAAQRVAALWALEGPTGRTMAITRQMLARPAGVAALAPRIAAAHTGGDALVQRLPRMVDRAQACAFMAAAGRANAHFSETTVANFRREMLRQAPGGAIEARCTDALRMTDDGS